ncbi:restriction endonuclease [Streptomyces kunmingensis]|uniref:Restriction endonuclease n=1 Tax=Streptomyces kunmingensis TaxID=68225 RepID=A0ABU6CA55_9ACTN|nr:restriction endonuclease [Streptomyces kunmingensis]MEB3961601.1 restriction endonuclease [Streptomyces kunmingensis]
MRNTRSTAGRHHSVDRLSGPLVALGLIGALLCAVVLLFIRFADWAGAHPVAAVLLALLAVPVLYVLFRAMPRTRELRRAARAGMAQADRELADAARATDLAVPSAAAVQDRDTVRLVPASAAVHDGFTTELPDPEPDFTDLDPDGFEAAVAALCERDGCTDVEVVGGAGDLGADVLATAPDGRRVVVQCKQYGPTNKVGSQDLQRFGGTCWTVHGAQLAVVVTTGEFTAPAEEYAAACGIRCIDGSALTAWAEGSGPAPWSALLTDRG